MINDDQNNCVENVKNAKLNLYYAVLTVNLLTLLSGSAIEWLNMYGSVSADQDLVSIIGGVIGVILWNVMAEKFGRKLSSYTVSAVFLIHFAVAILYKCTWYSRLAMGSNVSATLLNNLTYLNEITPVCRKKIVLSSLFISINIGFFIMDLLNGFLSYTEISIILLLLSGSCLMMLYPLPESPFYLLVRNNNAIEAEKAIAWCRSDESDIREEFSHLKRVADLNAEHEEVSFRVLFSKKHLQNVTVVIVLSVTQLFYGVDFIMGNSMFAFSNLGVTMSSVVFSFLILTMCVVLFKLINHVPRKVFLLALYALPCLSHVLTFFYMRSDAKVSAFHFTYGVVAFLLMAVFNGGVFLMPFFLFSEMFPSYLLSKVWSVYLVCVALSEFVFTNALHFSITVANILEYDFYVAVFIVLNASVIYIIVVLFKETKDNSYLEVYYQSETNDVTVNP